MTEFLPCLCPPGEVEPGEGQAGSGEGDDGPDGGGEVPDPGQTGRGAQEKEGRRSAGRPADTVQRQREAEGRAGRTLLQDNGEC